MCVVRPLDMSKLLLDAQLEPKIEIAGRGTTISQTLGGVVRDRCQDSVRERN
jgi:hypothetical protein